jgi:hypothetical protein
MFEVSVWISVIQQGPVMNSNDNLRDKITFGMGNESYQSVR